MAESLAMLGYGSIFQIQAENSPDNYVALAELINITPPSFTLDQIDVTHMESPNRLREFISGLGDPGECSFEMNFVPGSTSDDRLFELLNLPVGTSRRRACRKGNSASIRSRPGASIRARPTTIRSTCPRSTTPRVPRRS